MPQIQTCQEKQIQANFFDLLILQSPDQVFSTEKSYSLVSVTFNILLKYNIQYILIFHVL